MSRPAWAQIAETFGVLEPETARITGALSTARFQYANEIELHEGMVALLATVGIAITDADREVRLSPADRIDFLLPSGLGIEVKVKGQAGDVWRQLRRYAAHDRVRELLLVTTRSRHVVGPDFLNGKPVTVLLLRGGLR